MRLKRLEFVRQPKTVVAQQQVALLAKCGCCRVALSTRRRGLALQATTWRLAFEAAARDRLEQINHREVDFGRCQTLKRGQFVAQGTPAHERQREP